MKRARSAPRCLDWALRHLVELNNRIEGGIARSEWCDTVATLGVQALLSEPGAAVKALIKRAEIERVCVKDLQSALSTLDWAVTIDPESTEAWQAIVTTGTTAKDWRRVVKALGRQARFLTDPKAQADTFVRMGRLYWEHFRDRELAGDAYEARRVCFPTLLTPCWLRSLIIPT